MFNISFSELILIIIIILTLFNPKELLTIILVLYQLYTKLKQNIQIITHEIETNIVQKNIDSNDFYIQNDAQSEDLIYYQPEVDFDKEQELFDVINF